MMYLYGDRLPPLSLPKVNLSPKVNPHVDFRRNLTFPHAGHRGDRTADVPLRRPPPAALPPESAAPARLGGPGSGGGGFGVLDCVPGAKPNTRKPKPRKLDVGELSPAEVLRQQVHEHRRRWILATLLSVRPVAYHTSLIWLQPALATESAAPA